MVTCPRCRQPVDESVRTTCPLCFAPVPQNATTGSSPNSGQGSASNLPVPPLPPVGASWQPQAPVPTQPPLASPPAYSPGTRVSLTGEVIDSPPAVSNPSSAGQAPRLPTAQAAQTQQTQSRRGITIVVTAIVVIAILALAAGGWFIMNRTNPKDQALTVYKGFLAGEYKTCYQYCAFGPENLKRYPDADSFSRQIDEAVTKITANPVLEGIPAAMKAAAATATVGEPVINGNKADVPTTCRATLVGNEVTFKGTAHMVNQWGVWKVDLTSDAPEDTDKTWKDLVGTPTGLPSFGGAR